MNKYRIKYSLILALFTSFLTAENIMAMEKATDFPLYNAMDDSNADNLKHFLSETVRKIKSRTHEVDTWTTEQINLKLLKDPAEDRAYICPERSLVFSIHNYTGPNGDYNQIKVHAWHYVSETTPLDYIVSTQGTDGRTIPMNFMDFNTRAILSQTYAFSQTKGGGLKPMDQYSWFLSKSNHDLLPKEEGSEKYNIPLSSPAENSLEIKSYQKMEFPQYIDAFINSLKGSNLNTVKKEPLPGKNNIFVICNPHTNLPFINKERNIFFTLQTQHNELPKVYAWHYNGKEDYRLTHVVTIKKDGLYIPLNFAATTSEEVDKIAKEFMDSPGGGTTLVEGNSWFFNRAD